MLDPLYIYQMIKSLLVCVLLCLLCHTEDQGQEGLQVTCALNPLAVPRSVHSWCWSRQLHRPRGRGPSSQAADPSLVQGDQQGLLQLLLQGVQATVHVLLQPPLHLLQTPLHGRVQLPAGWSEQSEVQSSLADELR